MKKILSTIIFLFICIVTVQAQKAKYVFYFIGDGMGVNQVQGTEMFLSELKGEIGITPLLFTQFPYATIATTFSATNGVTDSAAAGNCGGYTESRTDRKDSGPEELWDSPAGFPRLWVPARFPAGAREHPPGFAAGAAEAPGPPHPGNRGGSAGMLPAEGSEEGESA